MSINFREVVGLLSACVLSVAMGLAVAGAAEEKPITPEAIVEKKFAGKATVEFPVGEVFRMLTSRDTSTDESEPLHIAPKAAGKEGPMYVLVSWETATRLKQLGIENLTEHFRGKVLRVSGTVERLSGAAGPEYRIQVNSLDQLESVGAAEADDRPAPDKQPVPIPDRLDIVNRLRDALKSGTPTEKEAALNMIRDLKPIKLIPELIEAIEDPTPFPDHVSGDCRTGWGFVGHHAATVVGEIARDIDGVFVGMRPGDRPYQSYSFHSELDRGAKLKESGRLAEVRKNWEKWWDAARK